MSEKELFQSQNYLVVKNLVPRETCELVVNYAKFQSLYDCTPERGNDAQVLGAHSRYADFLMESLLLQLQPKIERCIGESLLPCYSYYRVYNKGDVLEPHVDRESCELSLSVAFGWQNAGTWAFKLANDKVYVNGTPDCHSFDSENAIEVFLEPGDGIIYAGPVVKHWRDPLRFEAYVQTFFHYVRRDGEYATNIFDGRDGVGIPKITTMLEYVERSHLMKALISYLGLEKVNSKI